MKPTLCCQTVIKNCRKDPTCLCSDKYCICWDKICTQSQLRIVTPQQEHGFQLLQFPSYYFFLAQIAEEEQNRKLHGETNDVLKVPNKIPLPSSSFLLEKEKRVLVFFFHLWSGIRQHIFYSQSKMTQFMEQFCYMSVSFLEIMNF